MTQNLQNKIILITGASRGIGRAVALAASKAGADLIITGRTVGALEELDDEIKAAGGKATIVELDMQDYEAIPRLAAAINGRWGRLDGFVANAATLGSLAPLSHLDNSVWNDTIAVNLTAQWHLIKAMEPLTCRIGGSGGSGFPRCCYGYQTFLGAIRHFQGRARGDGARLGGRDRTDKPAH